MKKIIKQERNIEIVQNKFGVWNIFALDSKKMLGTIHDSLGGSYCLWKRDKRAYSINDFKDSLKISKQFYRLFSYDLGCTARKGVGWNFLPLMIGDLESIIDCMREIEKDGYKIDRYGRINIRTNPSLGALKVTPKFSCVVGRSCEHYRSCQKTRKIMRPCGRSNPKLGDKIPKHKIPTNHSGEFYQ